MADPAAALGLRNVPPHDYAQGNGDAAPSAGTLAVRMLTVAGAILVGFALVTTLNAGHDAAVSQDARKDELIALISARQRHADDLALRLETLRERVRDAEAAATTMLPAIQAVLDDAEAAAGMTPVAGPGLRLSLSDAAVACPETTACQIQDADLQDAVNTLFAVGAEAVAINGERVIATTAIRSAGQAILVNYRVLVSPYVITAVGDADALAARLEQSSLAKDFAIWTDEFGLGYEVAKSEELTVEAFDGSLQLGVASPIEHKPGETADAIP